MNLCGMFMTVQCFRTCEQLHLGVLQMGEVMMNQNGHLKLHTATLTLQAYLLGFVVGVFFFNQYFRLSFYK